MTPLRTRLDEAGVERAMDIWDSPNSAERDEDFVRVLLDAYLNEPEPEYATVQVKVRRVNLADYVKGIPADCVHLIPEPDGTYLLALGNPHGLTNPAPLGRMVSAVNCGKHPRPVKGLRFPDV